MTICGKCASEGHTGWENDPCPHPPERAARMLAAKQAGFQHPQTSTLHGPATSRLPKQPKNLTEIVTKLPNTARGGTLIAPPGECTYCDRRRAYTAGAMRRGRAKQKAEP
jgi:hypothetical protein